MLDPKEMKKGGFGAFAARSNELAAARDWAPSQDVPLADAPAPLSPAPTDAARGVGGSP